MCLHRAHVPPRDAATLLDPIVGLALGHHS
jgi:hypothetical protein